MNFDSTTLIVIGSICFSILITDGILLAIIFVTRRGVAKAASWASAMGRVTHSTIEYRRSSKGGSTAYPVVQYTYSVLGREYQGDRIMPGMEAGGSWAHKVVAKYPAGAQVTVYYDPEFPSNSVLERGMPGYIKWLWVAIILVDIFLCVLGAVLVYFM